MATMIVTRTGQELTCWVHDPETGVSVKLGSALNVPDAKLASRGQLTRLSYQLERLTMADVREGV